MTQDYCDLCGEMFDEDSLIRKAAGDEVCYVCEGCLDQYE